MVANPLAQLRLAVGLPSIWTKGKAEHGGDGAAPTTMPVSHQPSSTAELNGGGKPVCEEETREKLGSSGKAKVCESDAGQAKLLVVTFLFMSHG